MPSTLPSVSRWIGIAARRPVLVALLTTALLLPVIVVFAHLWAATPPLTPFDFDIFGPAGAALIQGQWGEVFRDAAEQGGPFELLPYGVAFLLHVTGTAMWTAFYSVVIAVLTFGVVLVARAGGTGGVLTGAACAILACAQSLLPRAVLLGHPAEVVIPLLWLVAARLARQERTVAAAAVIALSAGFEVWGVLGAVTLLLAERPRLLRSAAAAAAVLALLYGPFAATGDFAMFSFHWTVQPYSIFHAFAPGMTAFPWTLRLLQGAAALAAGAAVALVLRRSRWAPWLVVLAVIATRLLLDPVQAGYYWMAPSIVMVVLIVAAAARRDLLVLAVAVVGSLLSSVPVAPVAHAAALLVVTGSAVAVEAVRIRRSGSSPTPARPVPSMLEPAPQG